MKTIYKYPFYIEDNFSIQMPKGATVLSFANQHESPVIWVLVDTEAPLESYNFHISGTGHPISAPELLNYIGSAQFGIFVWHLFQERK